MRIKRQWLDTWDEHRLDLEAMIHRGEGVVGTLHLTARGRASGSRSTFASPGTSG